MTKRRERRLLRAASRKVKDKLAVCSSVKLCEIYLNETEGMKTEHRKFTMHDSLIALPESN